MSLKLNAFDQYDQAENRLTHALGVTLQRSADFKRLFLLHLAKGDRLGSDAVISLQMAKGRVLEDDNEKYGIPDLAIVDNKNRGIIIEAKLGSSLSWQQLVSHERRAERNGVEIASAVAITGRNRDRELLLNWNDEGRFKHPWHHVTWQQIYQLASTHANINDWVRELRDYMEIMATDLDEKEMGADVKIISFNGVTDEMLEDYSSPIARRILQSVMDELRSDKAFLSEIGMPESQAPRNRKAIKNSLRVWDFLSPLSDEDAFNKSHHFTVGVAPERIEAMLTIPNAAFRKFGKFAGGISKEQFAEVAQQFLICLKQAGVLKAGGRPVIVIVQRRYRVMTLHAVDGRMEFDLRTWKGATSDAVGPEIKRQPEWLEFCHQLITGRDSNIQFQMGVWFPFDKDCPDVKSRALLELIKSSFRSVIPFVQATGYA